MQISQRIQEMRLSPIRKLVPYAEEAAKKGIKVLYLNIGQPDLTTPPCFMDAIHKMDLSVIRYSHSRGEGKLLRAIQAYFANDGMNYELDQILVTNGGSEALTMLLKAVGNPGDEVLIPEPGYANTMNFILESSLTPVAIPTEEAKGYALPSKEVIQSLITSKTKAIIITNPNNPSGVVYSKAELEGILAVAKEHDLFVLCDEVYRKMTFDGVKQVSIGSLDGAAERVAIIDSVSKRYSACGARIGCVLTKNKDLMQALMKIAMTRLGVSTIDQIGAAALYSLDANYIETVRSEYEQRRDAILQAVKDVSRYSSLCSPRGDLCNASSEINRRRGAFCEMAANGFLARE
ncbi:MAG: pyridoxal phosphate-dependent aminotransferase [Bacillus subtilis]|nr:pyridoxal phosphate-dependent aminotransferase [Bacillus subtilis]